MSKPEIHRGLTQVPLSGFDPTPCVQDRVTSRQVAGPFAITFHNVEVVDIIGHHAVLWIAPEDVVTWITLDASN